MECLRLRLKDVDFDDRQLNIRDGKGRKDRVTLLPPSLLEPIQLQLAKVKLLHQQDLAQSYRSIYSHRQQSIEKCYARLITDIIFLSPIRILNCDKRPDRKYKDIKSLNIEDQDLRISAIVLSINRPLLTRNERHFYKVPDLNLENWTVR